MLSEPGVECCLSATPPSPQKKYSHISIHIQKNRGDPRHTKNTTQEITKKVWGTNGKGTNVAYAQLHIALLIGHALIFQNSVFRNFAR